MKIGLCSWREYTRGGRVRSNLGGVCVGDLRGPRHVGAGVVAGVDSYEKTIMFDFL
jgi:hypothetical protein